MLQAPHWCSAVFGPGPELSPPAIRGGMHSQRAGCRLRLVRE